MKFPIRLLHFITAISLSCLALTGWTAEYGVNLVTNGDAESGTALSSWTSAGPVTVHAYNGSSGFPSLTSPGSTTRGNNFFYGGIAETSTASQRIDLSFAAADIDTGKVLYDLSAWVGGHNWDSDNAAVIMSFQDASGNAVGSENPAAGPVSASDRNGRTQFLARAKTGAVPAGARYALVTMTFIGASGYLDEISLVLILVPDNIGTLAPSVACHAVLNADLSMEIDKFDVFADALTARLQFSLASDGSLVASVNNLGLTTKNNCDQVDIGAVIVGDTGYVLHLPSVMVGSNRYWANLDVLAGPNGTYQLRVSDYGPGMNDVTGMGSAFRALSKVEQFTSTGNTFSYRKIMPDDSVHQVQVILTPGQTYMPSAEEAAVISQLGSSAYGMSSSLTSTDNSSQYSAQFFVPYSSVSAETAQQIRNGGRANTVASHLAYNKSSKQANNNQFGVGEGFTVAINSVFPSGDNSVVKEFKGKLAEKGFEHIKNETTGKVAGKAVGLIYDGKDAWGAAQDHLGWNSRIDAAERCFNVNITDPLVKQQLGAQIKESRSEVGINAAVNYISMAASTALSFVDAGFAPLYVVTGAATDTVGAAVKEVNERHTQQIESAAGRCDIRWMEFFEGSGTDIIENKPGGLDYSSSSSYHKETTTFAWKTSNKVVFKDNTRGLQSPTYGKNHAVDYHSQPTITGTFQSLVTDGDYREECNGLVNDATWEGADVEITDNLAQPYPPTPEFYTKIPGFTAVRWSGNCTDNYGTSNAQGSVTLGISVHASFNMPANFRGNPVIQGVAGTNSDVSLDGLTTRSTNWEGNVKFIPF